MADTSRRGLITGLIAFAVTAPAIVRAGSLMPVKQMIEPEWQQSTGIRWMFPNRMYYLAGNAFYYINHEGGIWEVGSGEFRASEPQKL